MSILKIDWDYADMKRYLNLFKKSYTLLKYKDFCIQYAEVFNTKHGYHIYFIVFNELSNSEINMLECFLGSDIYKQIYFYIEDRDILFKSKNGYKEVFNKTNTLKLNRIIKDINSKKYVYTMLVY